MFVYLNTEYNERIKEELEYEYVIDCTGYKVEAPSKYMQGELLECIDK